jgi:hypothetical protein
MISELVPGYDDDTDAGYDSSYSFSDMVDGEHDGGERHYGSIAGASSAPHASLLPVGASALFTPPSSVSAGKTGKRTRGPLASLGVRPQFNLDSAEKLLAEWEGRMVAHFPAVAPFGSEEPPPEGEGEEEEETQQSWSRLGFSVRGWRRVSRSCCWLYSLLRAGVGRCRATVFMTTSLGRCWG